MLLIPVQGYDMFYKTFVDNKNEISVANKLRRQRFRIFLDMIEGLDRPIQVLDIGGRPGFWEMMFSEFDIKDDLFITLVNIEKHNISSTNIQSVTGDARDLSQFADQQFDIVFSNSTIEHVGDYDDQHRMAQEVKRLGKRYFIQTPNKFFPIEPHFAFPLFQFLPVSMRAWLAHNFAMGWRTNPIEDYQAAVDEVSSIRLLSQDEFQNLFPESNIYQEKYLGLNKSFVAYTQTANYRATNLVNV